MHSAQREEGIRRRREQLYCTLDIFTCDEPSGGLETVDELQQD